MGGYKRIHYDLQLQTLLFPDSSLPCVPEREGVTPVFPQPGWCGHNHSFAGLVIKVEDFSGILWTALEGQALGRELVATLCYINWQNKRKKENRATIHMLIHVLWDFFLGFLPDVTYFSWKLIPRHVTLLEGQFGSTVSLVSTSKIWTHLQTAVWHLPVCNQDLLKNCAVIFIELIVSL